jgi:hypothetical protein
MIFGIKLGLLSLAAPTRQQATGAFQKKKKKRKPGEKSSEISERERVHWHWFA